MRDNTPFTGDMPTVTAEEKAFIDNLVLSLFFEWQDEITAPGAKRDMDPLKPFMELTGADASSWLCIMYEAFLAGINGGLEIAHRINSIADSSSD